MNTAKIYHDSEGNECSIYQVVKREPEWAATRIQEGEKAIKTLAEIVPVNRNDVFDDAIDAINKSPFSMSSKTFPHRREHQEEGLIIAIRAIKALKDNEKCSICESEDVHINGFCIDCAKVHYE